MNTEIEYKLRKMLELKNQFKDIFQWDNGSVKYVAAILYAVEDQNFNAEKLERMWQLILSETKRFSAFRSSFLPILAILLALSQNPEELFADMKEIFELLRNEKFQDGALTVAMAYYIAVCGEKSKYREIVQNCRTLYKQMRKNHPILTGADDYLDIAMMVIRGVDMDAAIMRMEKVYTRLQGNFGKGNELQAIASAIVLLEEEDDDLCSKVLALDRELTERSCKIRGEGTAAGLAVLAGFEEDENDIADALTELIGYIKTLDGYDEDSVDDIVRYMIAVVFLIDYLLSVYGEKSDTENHLLITKTLCFMVLLVSCSSTTILL